MWTLQWQKAAVIAAAVLLCITSLLLPQFSQQVYAMVELEGAKSVSVKIDKNYKIQDAYSYDDTMSLKALKDLEGQKLQDLKEIVEELRDADGRLTVVYAMYKEDEKVSKELEEALQKIFGNENVTYMKGKIEEIQEPDKKQKTDIITGKEIIAEPKPAEEDDEEDTETDIEDAEEPENEEDESFSEEDEPDSEETDIEPETDEPDEPEIAEQENQKPEDTQEEPEEEEIEDEED